MSNATQGTLGGKAEGVAVCGWVSERAWLWVGGWVSERVWLWVGQ